LSKGCSTKQYKRGIGNVELDRHFRTVASFFNHEPYCFPFVLFKKKVPLSEKRIPTSDVCPCLGKEIRVTPPT